jgi:hypothetical protein
MCRGLFVEVAPAVKMFSTLEKLSRTASRHSRRGPGVSPKSGCFARRRLPRGRSLTRDWFQPRGRVLETCDTFRVKRFADKWLCPDNFPMPEQCCRRHFGGFGPPGRRATPTSESACVPPAIPRKCRRQVPTELAAVERLRAETTNGRGPPMERRPTTMKCTYVATYIAHDVAVPTGSGSVQLYADYADRTVAVLANDPSEILADADRGAAVASVVLRGVFGSADPRDIEVKLAEQVEGIRKDRLRLAASAPFLVVSVDLEVEPDLSGPHIDQTAYSVYFDAVDKKDIRATARPVADRVVAVAIIASQAHTRYDRIRESIYLTADDGRLIYPLSFTGHAPSLSVRSVDPELPAIVARYAAAARATPQPDLTTVYSLIRAAADGRTEPLRAFIAAWSALEIFTNKVFKQYERAWFDALAAERVPADVRQLSRIREVMSGKYRLVDSFTILASILAPGDADSDIATFGELKKARDALFHAGALGESDLPADRALAIVRKYVRLHLDRSAA